MKILFFAWMLLASQNLNIELLGSWKYVAYKYGGQVQPLPNPKLDLRFSFFESGSVKLKWQYLDESGFCEREATYHLDEAGWLYQKVTWLHPDNHISCAKDSDMQLGKESQTHVEFSGNNLLLELSLGGEPFFYILEPIALQGDSL